VVRAGLVLAAVVAAFGVLAGPALAVEPPVATQPYNAASDATFWNTVNNPALDPTDPRGFPTSNAANTRAGLWRMRAAGRILPATRVIGTIGLLTTATVLEWKFAHSSWNPGGFIYRRITGESYATTPSGTNEWRSLCASGCYGTTNSISGGPSLTSGWYLNNSSIGSLFSVPYTEAWSSWQNFGLIAGAQSGTNTVTGNSSCQSDGSGLCYVKTRTYAQMDRRLDIQPSDASAFAAAGPNQRGTATYTVPGDVGNAADIAAMRAALDAEENRDTRDYVNTLIDPTYDGGETLAGPELRGMTPALAESTLAALGHTGTISYTTATTATANPAYPAGAIIAQPWTPGATITTYGAITLTKNPTAATMPFALPAPLYGETADDYRTRLIAAGLLGTVTLTPLTDATAVPQLGRSAVVRVKIGTTTVAVPLPTSTPVPAPGTAASPWTAPSGKPANSPVEIQYNPGTLPEYPGPGLPGSGSGDGECPCPIPGLDFSPLSEISTGSTFPFGIFTFFGDILDHFNVTPEAPGWNFTLGTAAVGEYPFNWDLDAFSPYMAIVRSLISVALWIGAVWLLATRLLGFHAGGDLTEAADDGSVI
jgi:hypothetical protein